MPTTKTRKPKPKAKSKAKPKGKSVLKKQLVPSPESTRLPTTTTEEQSRFLTTPETYDNFFAGLYKENLNYVKVARSLGILDPYSWFKWHFEKHEEFRIRWFTIRDEIAWELVGEMKNAAMKPLDYRGVNFTPGIFLLKALMPATFGEQAHKGNDSDDIARTAAKIGDALIAQLEAKHGKI